MQSNRIVFETTAKKKICPFIQLNEFYNGGVTIEEQGIFKNTYCLVNDCMAWQYVNEEYVAVGTHKMKDTSEKTDRGYCVKLSIQ